MKYDTDIRRDLYGNIVVSGDTTVFPGLAGRMAAFAPANMRVMNHSATSFSVILAHSLCQVKIVVPSERKYGVWIGIARYLSESLVHQAGV